MKIITELEDPVWCAKYGWTSFVWGLGEDGEIYWKGAPNSYNWRSVKSSDRICNFSFDDMFRIVKAFEQSYAMKAFW